MTAAADHVAAAQRWLAEDPDPATREELEGLLEAGDEAALADRFATTLQFGTAGLRGALGAGPNRMNRAMVRRVTAGLAAYLQDAGPGPVVVGRDARHGSAAFAEDTCRVLAGAGLPVLTFPGPVPTPLVAYAVRALGAAAGVVITASHNPASDNGYKVYGRGGAQIVAPTDAAIATAFAAVVSLDDVPLAPPDDPLIAAVTDDLQESYLAAAAALAGDAPRDLRIVYTPLHGVAGTTMGLALVTAGFFDVHVVASQAEPDPDFPTVAFPNPEEPGALDEALALAREVDADLVIANDPDGDRVALGRARPGRLAHALGRRDRLPARRRPARPATTGAAPGRGDHGGVVAPAVADRRGARGDLRRDPHRLQVDRTRGRGRRPPRRALRAGLRAGPRRERGRHRARQGRHVGGGARSGGGRDRQGREPHPRGPARRPRARPWRAPHRRSQPAPPRGRRHARRPHADGPALRAARSIDGVPGRLRRRPPRGHAPAGRRHARRTSSCPRPTSSSSTSPTPAGWPSAPAAPSRCSSSTPRWSSPWSARSRTPAPRPAPVSPPCWTPSSPWCPPS